MKALLVVVYASLLVGYTSIAQASDPPGLGPLTNYYHDCPASRGPHAARLRSVIRRAVRGDPAAMRLLIMHDGIFSTGDNEGYSEVPPVLLELLGDDRYSRFITHQPAGVQEVGLALNFDQDHSFERRFPKTAKLYHERFAR